MEAKDSSQGVDKPESDAPGSEASNGGPVIPEGALVIIPMRNAVLFPGMILPFTIGRKGSRPGGSPYGRHAGQHHALRHHAGRNSRHCLPGQATLSGHRFFGGLSLSGGSGRAY